MQTLPLRKVKEGASQYNIVNTTLDQAWCLNARVKEGASPNKDT